MNNNAKLFDTFICVTYFLALIIIYDSIVDHSQLLMKGVTNYVVPNQFTKTGLIGQTEHVKFTYSTVHVYKAAQKIHDAAYQVTNQSGSCQKQVPQVMVLGVWKCGTREITDFMSMHPHIVIKTNPYEPNYFFRNKLDHGYKEYRQIMPCRYSDQLTWVKNPFYFTRSHITKEIHKFNPSLKMIVVIREPVERLLSSVTFNFRDKLLNRRFKNNITAYFHSDVTANGEVHVDSKHVSFSRYVDGFKEYMKIFRKDQFLFIDSNDFKNDPVTILQQVESFLGLKHFIQRKHFVFNYTKHFYCIRTSPQSRNTNTSATCYGSDRGRQINETKLHPTDEEISVLKKYFQPYNEELFKLLGRKMDW